ncbi:hypothetical protein DFH08DRAFT_1043233 [Mycena albidolilacea]|uniref:Uncharacterized protein n=1 Tax=Mycena albidolilacea TaxID=1033008 RepID=A0AAD7AGR5_9AGAR|nr:hypothetical protein DFH08DRAFT_1043233 [Mycena albidolilacea]
MLSARQPLRARCNVVLRVCTDSTPSSTKSKLPPNLVSSAGNTPPVRALPEDVAPPPLHLPSLSPYVLVDTFTDEAESRQFIPYLYLASVSSPCLSLSQKKLPRGSWTHAIRVLPASAAHPAGSTRITAPGTAGAQILDLYTLPGPPHSKAPALPLHRRHILVARDFLALALPYYSCGHPPPASDLELDVADSQLDGWDLDAPPPGQRCRTDAVRVLLLGPPRAILAVAFTYIAYAAECCVAEVMRCVVDEGEDQEACAVLGEDARMGLGKGEMRVLDRLAKKEM